ncbi:hypothetical protein BsWGS_11374 [Bradybaena similaris]
MSGQKTLNITQWNTSDIDNDRDLSNATIKRHVIWDHSASGDDVLVTAYSSTPLSQRASCCGTKNRKMDCSSCGLEAVPKPTSSDIEYLDLQVNLIHDLPDRVFALYTRLLVLNVSSNRLISLNNFSFYGLSQLTHLDLWNNSLLLLPTTYPDNVFKPLPNLVYLRINKNTKNCSNNNLVYPDNALAALEHLQYLLMDGLANHSFPNLTRLTNLTLAGYLDGYCCMYTIGNSTFENLKNLKYLDLNNCHINGSRVDTNSFQPLSELEVLNLSHNEELEFKGLKNILHGLRKSKLKELNIQLITNRYSFGSCLENHITQYLPETVEHIDARQNSLYAVDRQVIGNLPPALKEMDLSGNMFGFATYFQDLHLMHNLTKVHLNGANYIYPLPYYYPFRLTTAFENNENSCTPYSTGTEGIGKSPLFELSLPPNLTYIEMNNTGLRYRLTQLNVNPNNKLEMLSLNGNLFESLIGPFNGLHSLKRLDLSSCSVRNISNNFFVNLTSLQTLNLGFNLIGNLLSAKPEANPFSMLSNLKKLNLSSNYIETLPKTIFAGLTHLETLILSRNQITKFSVHITNLKHLKVLDLSNTNLNQLPKDTRNYIDHLLENNVPIQVDMSDSPILCTCENLDFLEWLVVSKAFSGNFSNYDCINPDSSRLSVKNGYNETVNVLRRHCIPHDVMFLWVTVSTLVMFGILLGLLIYRFRWKLRYFYYAAYVFYVKRERNTDSDHFRYDTFVSYDHKDARFVREKLSPELHKRGLKLCIHDRDFTAGDFIGSNIVNAICDSRRTLVVLTKHLIASYWCNYEIQMANMESVHTGRQVLVFLLMEKIVDNIGTELRYNISNNTYMAYPDKQANIMTMDLFWDKLALDLKN